MDIKRNKAPLLKRFINRNVLAVLLFVLFVLVNTLKLSAFDLLIVGSNAFPVYDDIVKAFWGKIFMMSAVGIILLRTRRRWPFLLFYSLQTIYITVNLMYFFSFQGYLHVGQYLNLFSEGFDLVRHSALPWDTRSLFIITDLPLAAAVFFFYPPLADMNKRYFFRPFMYTGSAIFLWFFYKWDPPLQLPLQAMNNAYASDVTVVSEYGLMTFNIMDLLNYADARSHIRQLNFGPVVTAPVIDSVHPNILVIQVESLDANIINYTYKKEYVTPYLHELSCQCIYFPYAMSYHLAGSSSDCDFSTLNSVEPFDNYPAIKIRNYDYSNCILKQLTACGYRTEAFHGNRGTYFNRNIAFKKMGFQKFYDIFGMGLHEVGWGAPDEAVFDFVASHMANQQQPFFYYVITMCTHEPFTLVKQYYNNRKFDLIQDGAQRNYLNSMSYLDLKIKKFITSVRAAYPNTVIIFYGDHTPTLPKCAYSKAIVLKHNRLFEYVPLFILLPEKTVYTEHTYAASFLDIGPTVLAASRCGGQIHSHGLNLLAIPLHDKEVPYRNEAFSRKELFAQIEKKR